MLNPTNGSKPEISIVIPVYNEEANIEYCIKQIDHLRLSSACLFEVIIVNGASTDNTAQNLEVFVSDYNLNDVIRVENLSERKGYGHDIVHGLKLASAPLLAWTHADLQTDIADVFRACDLIKSPDGSQEKTIVKGNRKKRQLFDYIFTLGMQLFTLIILKVNISDINAQPKVFTSKFFKRYIATNFPDDFSLDLFLLWNAKKSGHLIKEIPVYYKNRQFGEAKGGGGGIKMKYILIKRTIHYILNLRKYRSNV